MANLNIFKVLSDKQRRDILEMLKNGRLSAGEISFRCYTRRSFVSPEASARGRSCGGI